MTAMAAESFYEGSDISLHGNNWYNITQLCIFVGERFVVSPRHAYALLWIAHTHIRSGNVMNNMELNVGFTMKYIYIYIYMCVCVCVHCWITESIQSKCYLQELNITAQSILFFSPTQVLNISENCSGNLTWLISNLTEIDIYANMLW